MNATLEDRLRQHYSNRTVHLPQHGPGIDTVVVRSGHYTEPTRNRSLGGRVAIVAGLAAAVAVVLVVVTNRGDERSIGTSSTPTAGTSQSPTSTGLAPAVTLARTNDVSETPATEEGTSPTMWYRLQPDFDVANLPSQFCWRTPVDTACVPDDASNHPLPLVVPTGGGQTLVMISGDPSQRTLDVTVSDGTTATAPISWDSIVQWGVARFALPSGASIVGFPSVWSRVSPSTADAVASIPGQTVPGIVGTSDTPITVPAGSPLSYWRFLPDLEISEREATTASGTELCWRTPVGTGCLDDSFVSPQVGIVPTTGGYIALARPALVLVSPLPSDPSAPKFKIAPIPTSVSATLSDGSTVKADLSYLDTFGVGYARLNAPVGTTVMSAISG
jgi:hypothetical protein